MLKAKAEVNGGVNSSCFLLQQYMEYLQIRSWFKPSSGCMTVISNFMDAQWSLCKLSSMSLSSSCCCTNWLLSLVLSCSLSVCFSVV